MRRMILSIAIASSALLAGCAPKVQYVDTFCTSYVPTTYSASGDTKETKKQIKANNAVWKKLCK